MGSRALHIALTERALGGQADATALLGMQLLGANLEATCGLGTREANIPHPRLEDLPSSDRTPSFTHLK